MWLRAGRGIKNVTGNIKKKNLNLDFRLDNGIMMIKFPDFDNGTEAMLWVCPCCHEEYTLSIQE